MRQYLHITEPVHGAAALSLQRLSIASIAAEKYKKQKQILYGGSAFLLLTKKHEPLSVRAYVRYGAPGQSRTAAPGSGGRRSIH